MSNQTILKPILTGVIAGLADKYINNNNNNTELMYLAGSVAVGVYTSQMIAPLVPSIPTMESPLYNGKTVMTRTIEIGSGTAVSYGVNKYLANNEKYEGQWAKKMVLIGGADFVAEYLTDYLQGRELSFFK